MSETLQITLALIPAAGGIITAIIQSINKDKGLTFKQGLIMFALIIVSVVLIIWILKTPSYSKDKTVTEEINPVDTSSNNEISKSGEATKNDPEIQSDPKPEHTSIPVKDKPSTSDRDDETPNNNFLPITIKNQENNEPLEGVRVIGDDFEAITDANGKFRIPGNVITKHIKEKGLYSGGITVTLQKEGYKSNELNIGLSEPASYKYKLIEIK